MPNFRVPVKWSRWGIHEIEAKTKEEAIHHANFLPLPYMDDLVPDSFTVLTDQIEEVKETSMVYSD